MRAFCHRADALTTNILTLLSEGGRIVTMGVGIHPIRLGFDCVYVLEGNGGVVIDGGAPRQLGNFVKGLKKSSIRPDEVELIVLTHGHWDHIASARDIKNLTGAKIAMHHREREWLESSLKPMPPGVTPWGRVLGKLLGALVVPFVHIPPAKVDLALEDGEFSLAEYGIPGTVIPTPGHSSGSVSVLLETGEAFVGDLAMNAFPLCLSPGLPIFAEDIEQLKQSWRLLLERGARTVYPAHGDPFPAEVMRKALATASAAQG
jgi:glyoxylase-like metal-dependent hydrolase (beta-lactamase superfamily II)